jgi:hypothetical protein
MGTVRSSIPGRIPARCASRTSTHFKLCGLFDPTQQGAGGSRRHLLCDIDAELLSPALRLESRYAPRRATGSRP